MGRITQVTLPSEPCLHHACCVNACPQVFQIRDDASYAEVRADAHLYFDSHAAAIREAVDACPVSIISISEEPDPSKSTG